MLLQHTHIIVSKFRYGCHEVDELSFLNSLIRQILRLDEGILRDASLGYLGLLADKPPSKHWRLGCDLIECT